MSLLVRYRLSLAIVLVAVAATAGFFVFARPEHGQPDQRIVKLAYVHHYGAAQVRSVFAARGISLRYTSTATPGMLWLSSTPFPVPTSGLYVLVAGAKGTIGWGPKIGSAYDQPIGNLDVHYGGTDTRTLGAIKAAVSDLH